jgi:hypothetical protein
MPTIYVSIPARDQWPSDDEMRERNAAIAELEAGGIGECIDNGGGCGVMESSLDVDDIDRAQATLGAVLNARFPGRRFNIRVEEADDVSEARSDRDFYDSLGAEREGVPCRHAGCTRGAVSRSVLCRRHHFEQVQGRACPFRD